MPVSRSEMRPSGLTAVASVTIRPAPPAAIDPRCTRCQSVGTPSRAWTAYWHIGATQSRLRIETPRRLIGSKRETAVAASTAVGEADALISDTETTYRECMAKPRRWLEWEAAQARDWIAVPQAADDKYSRGVLGLCTGSTAYPGAAVLGVEAAGRTGVGMLRYLGPRRVATLVLQRRPEVVTADGRVQAWLLGSGMDAGARSADRTQQLRKALRQGLPTVLDAGALDLVGAGTGARVITPHYRELAALLERSGQGVPAGEIAREPGDWAVRAAELLGVTVLLKGSTTYVAAPSGIRLSVSGAPAWLATAGSGDVLAGILGALLATHSDRIDADADAVAALAATASFVHAAAASRASAGGPIVALDIAEAVPATIAALLA